MSRGGRPPRIRWPFRSFNARKVRRTITSTIVHTPNYFLPELADGGVVTAHDLSVFRFPETHPPERVAAFDRKFGKSLERASQVITDTETVRQEMIEAFAIPEDRITAVALGVDDRFHPRDGMPLAEPLNALGLRKDGYGLCVSTLEPRKRIVELLAAWQSLPRSLRDRFPLVLAGAPGWLNDDLHSAIEQATSEGWLRHLGFVDETVLPELYAGAGLFVYPSIYEGFGLPPLEAMASGVPVIVSNRSCLPEVCGSAARYVDPDDVDGFAAAIVEGLTDDAWRKAAVSQGLDRARKFTWDRCIDRTVAVYRRAAAA